jgi:hypothetical protein
MDPYEYARQQGQVMGQPDVPADDYDAEDLMDLLLHAYHAAGHVTGVEEGGTREELARFAGFCNDYLADHRVASTGVVDGGFALVFEDGRAVSLATVAEAAPARPDPVIPITTPKSSKMRGLPVDDTAIQITTGDPHKARRPR